MPHGFLNATFKKIFQNINVSLICATSQNHEHLMLRRTKHPSKWMLSGFWHCDVSGCGRERANGQH